MRIVLPESIKIDVDKLNHHFRLHNMFQAHQVSASTGCGLPMATALLDWLIANGHATKSYFVYHCILAPIDRVASPSDLGLPYRCTECDQELINPDQLKTDPVYITQHSLTFCLQNGLEQSHILSLLKEAATANQERLNRIVIELRGAVCQLDQLDFAQEARQDTLETMVDSLFWDAVKNAPADKFPSLFPAIAMLCGARDTRDILANVDWTLVQ